MIQRNSYLTEIASRSLRRIFRRQSHYIFHADCRDAAVVEWPENEKVTKFSRTNPMSGELLDQVMRLLPSSREYIEAVDNGEAEGLLVCVDGKIVHSAYLMFENKTTRLLGCNRSWGLLGNSFTITSHRGRGCQARSTRERIAMAAAAGLTAVISETSPDNLASQRGLQRGGMRFMGQVQFFVILNIFVIRTRRIGLRVPMFSLCL
jgi:RimJ/RimL family protein N-acetyltransferase